MIEGNHLAELSEVFEVFEYQDTGNDRVLKEWSQAANLLSSWMLSRSRVLKLACFHQGWTIIFDPEMVMPSNENACHEISSRFHTRVFGMICEGASNTYAFSLFDRQKMRSYFSVGGEVLGIFGEPLLEEKHLDQAQAYFEDDILAIMQGIGVDYEKVINEADYLVVKELESETDIPEISSIEVNSAKKGEKRKKPWWKFWGR